LAYEASNGRRWIGVGAAKFLTAVDELDSLPFNYQQDAVRVFRNGIDPLIFEFSIAIAPMNAPKCLFAELVSFVVQRCACQLLLSACRLTFSMFIFTL
jgi:hypothetical protein